MQGLEKRGFLEQKRKSQYNNSITFTSTFAFFHGYSIVLAQMQILDGLRKMKAEAEKKIEKILAEVWGGETK